MSKYQSECPFCGSQEVEEVNSGFDDDPMGSGSAYWEEWECHECFRQYLLTPLDGEGYYETTDREKRINQLKQ